MSDYKDGDKVTGVVEVLTEKPAGRGKVYNIKMDSGDWFGCGFKAPSFKQGDHIKFEVELNKGYVNLNHDTVEIVEAGASQTYTRDPKGISAVDKRTVLHAARGSAIEMVQLLVNVEGALTIPSKKSDKHDYIDSLVNEYTATWYEQGLAVMKGEFSFENNALDPDDLPF